MYSIRINIPEPPTQSHPVGLLVPIPPNTAHQRLVSIEVSGGGSPARLRSPDMDQEAFFCPNVEGASVCFEYRMTSGDGKGPPRHFDLVDNRFTRASGELAMAIKDLVKGTINQRDALQRVVEYTTSMFDYDHPPVKFYDGMNDVPLLLSCTKGSCTDINTFLISSLRAIGVPCTYYAGYFFPADRAPTVTGFHCWVTTLADGLLEDWDIAQHLIAGVTDVKAELNPEIPGVRLAMSCGRGIRFAVPDHEITLPHFAYPFWILPDGSYVPANAEATLAGPGPRHQQVAAAA